MSDLLWSNEARADLYGILNQYQPIDAGLADATADKILAAPSILLERPFLGPPVGAHRLHKWRIRDTPYLLLYRPLPDAIEIVRIRHEREDWESGL